MSAEIRIDFGAIQGYSQAMKEAPRVMLRELAKAYQNIGRYDISKLKASLPDKLHIRSKGLANSFKSKGTDPSKATDFSKLFATEYTGWKASEIFQAGGTITGHGQELTILTDAARGAGGKRTYTRKQLLQMILNKTAIFIPTPRGVLLVQPMGGVTKKGKYRKGSKMVILAILRKSVHESKRLNFYENAEANSSMHQDFLETAVENALVEIAQERPNG